MVHMRLILPNSRANRGKWYQRLVTAACRLYDAQERAYIAEIPTPMGIAKGGEAAFFKEKAIIDYCGTLSGGRSIAFDAKRSLDGAYRAGVPDNQLRVMERVHKLGGVSGVLIGFQVRETIRSWVGPVAIGKLHCLRRVDARTYRHTTRCGTGAVCRLHRFSSRR